MQRFWGLDIIAAIYGIATLLLAWLFFNGTGAGQAFARILGPVAAAFCLGMVLRNNVIRKIMIGFFFVSLIVEELLAVYYFDVLLGLADGPPNRSPAKMLLKLAARATLTYVMYRYLKRPDVRELFTRSTQPSEM